MDTYCLTSMAGFLLTFQKNSRRTYPKNYRAITLNNTSKAQIVAFKSYIRLLHILLNGLYSIANPGYLFLITNFFFSIYRTNIISLLNFTQKIQEMKPKLKPKDPQPIHNRQKYDKKARITDKFNVIMLQKIK